jgi:hypothetical protein
MYYIDTTQCLTHNERHLDVINFLANRSKAYPCFVDHASYTRAALHLINHMLVQSSLPTIKYNKFSASSYHHIHINQQHTIPPPQDPSPFPLSPITRPTVSHKPILTIPLCLLVSPHEPNCVPPMLLIQRHQPAHSFSL